MICTSIGIFQPGVIRVYDNNQNEKGDNILKSKLSLYLRPLWYSLAGQVLGLTQDGGPPSWLIQGKNVIN